MSPQFYGAVLFGVILSIIGFIALHFENKQKRRSLPRESDKNYASQH